MTLYYQVRIACADQSLIHLYRLEQCSKTNVCVCQTVFTEHYSLGRRDFQILRAPLSVKPGSATGNDFYFFKGTSLNHKYLKRDTLYFRAITYYTTAVTDTGPAIQYGSFPHLRPYPHIVVRSSNAD